ncbi:MAG: DUF3352 domain-containing protein [Bacteroidetes bacterium]|nr:DUF3352 domain-containing protein [Bacteroidota bacterium]
MKRKKKLILGALAVAVGLAVLGQFVRLPLLGVHPHEAIPRHSAAVLNLNREILKKLGTEEGKNSMANLALPTSLGRDLKDFGQYFSKKTNLKNDGEFLAVLQPTRSSGIDVLFIFDGMRGKNLAAILTENQSWRVRKSIFKNNEVFTVEAGQAQFALAKFRNLLLFARHAYLLENAISQLEHPANSLCRDSGFSQAGKGFRPQKNALSLMLNLPELGPQFSPLLDAASVGKLDGLGSSARWLRLDLPTGKTTGEWTGTFTASNGNPLLEANSDGPSQPFKNVFRSLPDNLALVWWLSCGRIVAAEEAGTWRRYFAPWVGNEAAFALGEPLENDAAEQFFLLKTKNSKAAEAELENLAKHLNSTETFDFQLFKIRRFTGLALGKMLQPGGDLTDPYGTVLGEYVLFSNTKTGMERWLGKYLAGQTYSKSVPFLQSLRNLPVEAQGFLYFDSGRAWQQASHFFDEKMLVSLGHNPLKFNLLAATMTRRGTRCDLTIVTPKNEARTTETAPANILWKTPLGSEAAIAPAVFQNPETGEPEIFVQDSSHVIYLISRSGRIVWRRNFEEPIRSKIFQLDLDNSKETQFAFSTPTGIFVLDHFGQDVAGFPLRLQTPATNGLAVVDFFKSHDYQFFIACENGNAYGFDEKGSPVEGWRPKTGVGTVRHPLTHFQAKGMDFLMLLDTAGTLQVFQKNGEFRFPKKNLGGNFLQSPDYQVSDGNYRIVACDDRGRVSVVNLEGGDFKLSLKAGKNEALRFAFADIAGDERKDYLALSNQELAAWFYEGKNFEKAFGYSFSQPQDEVFPVVWQGRKKAFTGTVCREKSQLSLLDGQGKLLPQFPLAGTTAFSVVDLLGNGKPVVVAGNGASVVAYALE